MSGSLRVGRLAVIGLLLVFGFASLKSGLADEPSRPNIVVIMADDLGYGDVSCYGANTFETPNIDQLARRGVRFTSGYCSASTCTPTRYSFLTGNYAFRKKGTGIAPPNSPLIIDPAVDTLPKILQRAGYRTAVVGKWHLGLGGQDGPDWNGDLKPGPLELGFDRCFLLPTTNDRVPQVFVEQHRVRNLDPSDPLWVGDKLPGEGHPNGIAGRASLRMDWDQGHNGTIHNGISRIGYYTGGHVARFRDEDLADEWVRQSNRFMEESGEQPFFLFFSSHDLHVPRMPHERFQGTTPHGLRTDAIVELDWCVGELMESLKRLGKEKNTLVIFCSDNGPVLNDGYKDAAVEKNAGHKAAGPFHGGKYSVYEGGTRTPFVTSWPGKISPSVSDEIVCTIDLAASLGALTGVEPENGNCIDSENILGALLGQSGATGRKSLVQQDNGSDRSRGFRSGNWKLVRLAKPKRGSNQSPGDVLELYDLSVDPAESKNVGAENPTLVLELEQELTAIENREVAGERGDSKR